MTPAGRAGAIALWALCAGPLAAAPAAARVVDGVVAVVNGDPLTFSEVRDVAAEGMGIPVGDADGYLREEREPVRVFHWIESLVESALVRQELSTLGQSISDPEVDRAVEGVKKGNNLTDEKFLEALAKEGQTLDAYRRRIRWQMERAAIVRAKKFRDVTITGEEIKAAFRESADRFLEGAEVKVDVLNVPMPEGTDEERNVRVRIATLQAAEFVRQGKTLPEAAALLATTVRGISAVSSDFMKTDELQPEIQREIRRLRNGETSPPFFTEDGGHIVTVVARRGGTLPELSAVRDRIDEDLTDRRSEKAYADILAELKKRASVDVHL